jgi:hypothetical protein
LAATLLLSSLNWVSISEHLAYFSFNLAYNSEAILLYLSCVSLCLIQAIQEELNEQEMLRRENEELQKSIIAIEPNYDTQDKQPDVQMNEHKYLNTLANVHQVRINLKETQDRYNKMASEL